MNIFILRNHLTSAHLSLRWCELTVLRLPPLQLPLRLEGGDDVLDLVAAGVAVAIVRQPGVAGETFLLLLSDEDTQGLRRKSEIRIRF